MITVLVTGGKGQLGRALGARTSATTRVVALDVDQLDVRDAAQIERGLTAVAPAVVVNCAAYTAVDRAEAEPELAHAINRDAAAALARACFARGIALVHVSTDYVFDGTATRPYREDDAMSPVGVYGASKAAGEQAVRASGGVVVRTSWLFGDGGPSFVHTMLRLARERPVLRVVSDQHGCPTYAGDLADALLAVAGRAANRETLSATYHYCNAGPTTWHHFATEIVAELRRLVETPIMCERIDAITTAEYPTAARRPAYSVLDTTRIAVLGVTPPDWRAGMRRVVAQAVGA